ncbi:MAG TPA: ABC transporter ATP-binding protein [Jatrophihabitantaceae bacterium]|jgi:iron(III) transport system ATP-binding protein|nr:ABC transporter ATP-binding protein [Jatrophihabitantaceae bacterium]
MGDLTVSGLTKSFGARGSKMLAVDDFNVEVKDRELLVLLGPSGCGKSTTIRALAGLEAPDAGRITYGSQVVFDAARHIDVRPNKRDIGMVFQSFALWPHMTVRRNIAYPLKARRRRELIAQKAVEKAAELVDCTALLDRYPSQLSGGQQQRVALARALVARPAVMLFDEPLSNLDAKLRDQLRTDLHRLHREVGFTGVYVTHDHAEALALGDRLAIMRAGRIEQLGTPALVFSRPRTEYVAGFIGIDNVIELRRDGDGWGCPGGSVHGAVPAYESDVVRLRIRNEDVRLRMSTAELTSAETGIAGATVVDVSFQGRSWAIVADLGGVRISADLDGSGRVPSAGDTVIVTFEAQHALVYGATGELLSPEEPSLNHQKNPVPVVQR